MLGGEVHILNLLRTYLTWDVEHILLDEDRFGRSPLHTAAQQGHTDVVKMLLELPSITFGLHPESMGGTALHAAAYSGVVEVTQMILERQIVISPASINYRNDNRYTPLQVAVRGGHTRVVKLLLDAPNIETGIGPSATHFAFCVCLCWFVCDYCIGVFCWRG